MLLMFVFGWLEKLTFYMKLRGCGSSDFTAGTCWVSCDSSNSTALIFLFQFFSAITVRKEEEILWILSINCCPKKCLKKLSCDDIHYCEVRLHDKNQTEKRNFVLEFLQNQSQTSDSGEYVTELIGI